MIKLLSMKIENDISAKTPSSNEPLPFILDSSNFKQAEYAYVFDEMAEDKIINWPMVYILTKDRTKRHM